MILAFLRGLEKAPTFLVPIINPPFADNSPHLNPSGPGAWYIKYLAPQSQRHNEAERSGRMRSVPAGGLPQGRTIRPAVSLMILKAAAAVMSVGSRDGFNSTMSRPTIRPLSD